MRKSVLVLSVLLLACAEAPVDDTAPAAESTNKTEPEQSSSKLPPPSNPPSEPKDAGTSASNGTNDAGTTPKDAGTSPPPTSNDAGTTGTSTSCDPNNSTYALKAFAELNKSSPRTCGSMGGTCTSTECCFDLYGVCVDK